MTFVSWTQFHGRAFSVITNLQMQLFEALFLSSHHGNPPKSRSASMKGPGRRMTSRPSSCAVERKATRSLFPEKS